MESQFTTPHKPRVITIKSQAMHHHHSSSSLLSKAGSITPKKWPVSPQPVTSSATFIWLDLLADTLFLALCTAFFVFALAVRGYDKSVVQEHQTATNILFTASKYGPTIFPILFACLLGRATHTVLVRRLEKGTRISLLDTLAGSTSLTSTILSQCTLRFMSVSGFALVAIRILSPIGGQASLRLITKGSHETTSQVMVEYFQPNGQMPANSRSDTKRLLFSKAYLLTALYSPHSSWVAASDLWGNAKIPQIEALENGPGVADAQGWFDVSVGGKINKTYTSFVGVAMTRPDGAQGYNISVKASYSYLNCSISTQDYSEISGPVITGTPYPVATIYSSTNEPERFLAPLADIRPRNFIYGDWDRVGSYHLPQCILYTTYIEVGMITRLTADNTLAWAASRVRRSLLAHPPPGFTMLDSYNTVGSYVINSWNLTIGGLLDTVNGPNPAKLTGYIGEGASISDSVPVDPDQFALRFGQMINKNYLCLTVGESCLKQDRFFL